jgi:hypothetical protein
MTNLAPITRPLEEIVKDAMGVLLVVSACRGWHGVGGCYGATVRHGVVVCQYLCFLFFLYVLFVVRATFVMVETLHSAAGI